MLRKASVRLLFCVLLAGLTLWGLFGLFHIRFSQGDHFPAYSSLRSDPLGTKMFFESLTQLETLETNRSFHAPDEKSYPENSTLFFLGLQPRYHWWIGDESAKSLQGWINRGGQLVVAYNPRHWLFRMHLESEEEPENSETEEENSQDTSTEETAAEKEEEENPKIFSLLQRWGVEMDTQDRETYQSTDTHIAHRVSDNSLPKALTWEAPLTFKLLHDDWQVLYSLHENPVMIERTMGLGKVILLADSFPFSNEGLWKKPQSRLLTYCIGSSRTVLFDETHLGLKRSESVGFLIRKYHLYGLLAGLILLLSLWLWQVALPLMPRTASDHSLDNSRAIQGRHSMEGFNNCLRHHLAPDQLTRESIRVFLESLKYLPRLRNRNMKKLEDWNIENTSKKLNSRQIIVKWQEIHQWVTKRKLP